MALTPPPASPVCTVVIPCRGDWVVLKRCLRALSAQTASFPFEVIVVESSDDRHVEDVVRSLPQARLIRSDVGLLPGAARNRGAQNATGDILAFTDSDCEPDTGWLDSVSKALGQDAKFAGGAVGNSLPLHPIAVADNLMQFADYLSGRPEGPVNALPGCNLAARRLDFDCLGGFRENLDTGEDTLFVELASRRWPGQVVFDPRMRVLHRGRTTLGSFWKHQERFGYHRGVLGLRLKAGFQERGRNIPFVILLCLRRLAYFLTRTIQWEPLGLPRFLVILPLIAFGLAAYGKGFLNGCRMTARYDK
jgi:GT2 family glycosyltransferase